MEESRGFTLGSTRDVGAESSSPAANVRNMWAQRWAASESTTGAKKPESEKVKEEVKTESGFKKPVEVWEELDDEIMIKEVHNEVIELESSDDEDNQFVRPKSPKRAKPADFLNHSQAIKNEVFDDLGVEEDDIEFIDDDFDDELGDESFTILSDSSVLDDLFGNDTLMDDFNSINGVIMSDKENRGNKGREIITCPICQDQMPRDDLSSHLDGCSGIKVELKHRPKGSSKKNSKRLPFYTASTASTSRGIDAEDRQVLLKAGYSSSMIDSLNVNSEEREYNARINREMREERVSGVSDIGGPNENNSRNEADDAVVPCPVCNKMVIRSGINAHLDQCLAAYDE